MSIVISIVTPIATLLGVMLGGWLSTRNQDRLWRREHDRHWSDIRLSTYTEFLTAYRRYLAFALEPTANITAVPHAHTPGKLMPFFDEKGRLYKETLDAAIMSVRLVSSQAQTAVAAKNLIDSVRAIAAARATYSEQEIPQKLFEELWQAHGTFLVAARAELGLANILPDIAL